MIIQRKKLIEVSLPLEAINAASAREKSIRHGHPSTLHLWWARRPLAACRAVLFTQLVDDPSSWPDEYPTEEDQARERERLHGIIKDMVPWKATNNERILGKARYEIARSIARGRGDTLPQVNDNEAVLDYLAEHAPPVCDPFCGGGSIPLEAQRLGLRAHGSDLNPVAVLVSKATCEIPPKFANRPPINPDRDLHVTWKGAQGLAEDIRYYGRWMRDQAESRIGHLYPKVRVTKAIAADRDEFKPYVGKDLTVIAWLWARTVASPDPMMRGKHVPLVSSLMLSTKPGKKAWADILRDVASRDGWRFEVNAGTLGKEDETKKKLGTKAGKAQDFLCCLSGTPVQRTYIQLEGKSGHLGKRLMAIVLAGSRERLYLSPNDLHEGIAESPEFAEMTSSARSKFLSGTTPTRAMITGGVCSAYGFATWGHLFTDRQLVALTTFSGLLEEAREQVLSDARDVVEGYGSAADWLQDTTCLADNGTGAQAYADAVATYLGCAVDKAADYWSGLCSWHSSGQKMRNTFGRQAIPMVWDYAEGNPFSASTGNWVACTDWVWKVVGASPVAGIQAAVIQQDAAGETRLAHDAIVATDPPYYDNIGYAELSDFFYVWQRRTLRNVWPDLFRRVLVPKDEELVATPYRHGGKAAAEQFFMDGIGKALANMHASGRDDFPVTIYYAFKQSEIANEGLTSPGWATFLHAVIQAGYVIGGTWPVRTELVNKIIAINANVLASSIVLVCRKRPPDAPVITRREFVARLRSTLPAALARIRAGGVGPVDMAQASIGPGMGVFTAAAKVLEPDDTPMTVRTAIALINQIRDEISGEEATGYDADTRFCIEWFENFGMDEGKSGDAITMAQAYDIGIEDLENAGVFDARGGSARLLRRDELPGDWNPATDRRLTDWECAQHLARTLESPAGGIETAAKLYANMPPERSEAARMLAYRLYDICERKDRAAEAQVWNMLAREWTALETAAAAIEPKLGSGQLLL
ncbi:MAG: DUF1156 domain-containing protein [Gammaproteobacteria bacterium]|nr:DUF1156 domain-containing protein [Gammaproteobacteria bacterium]